MWSHRTMVQLGNEAEVPQLQVFIAQLLALASIIAFIVLIDYAARLLRPVSLVGRVGEQGLAVINNVYPEPTHDMTAAPLAHAIMERRSPDHIVYYPGKSGIVLAVNLTGLVAEAQRADGIIEVVPQVGDFLAFGEPLFYLYGNAGAIDDRALLSLIALGSERTMEQDPIFSF